MTRIYCACAWHTHAPYIRLYADGTAPPAARRLIGRPGSANVSDGRTITRRRHSHVRVSSRWYPAVWVRSRRRWRSPPRTPCRNPPAGGTKVRGAAHSPRQGPVSRHFACTTLKPPSVTGTGNPRQAPSLIFGFCLSSHGGDSADPPPARRGMGGQRPTRRGQFRTPPVPEFGNLLKRAQERRRGSTACVSGRDGVRNTHRGNRSASPPPGRSGSRIYSSPVPEEV